MGHLADPLVLDVRNAVDAAGAHPGAVRASADRLLTVSEELAVASTLERSGNGLSPQTEDVLHSILRAAREHFALDVAFISRFRDGRRFFVSVDASTTEIQVGASDPLEDSYCARVVDGRLPQLMGDARDNAEARSLPGTQALDVRTHLGVAIRLPGGGLYGTFCCFGSTPSHDLDEGTLRAMNAFAQLAAEALARDEAVTDRLLARAAEIHDLISEDRIRIHYQPIVDLATGTPVGYEALSRFETDPVFPPDHWFGQAASAGLGLVLEARAIELALPSLTVLPASCYLAVNASASTVESGLLRSLLDGADGHRIVLELTEHDRAESLPRILDRLDELRATGVRLSIDDTGTGYAGMQRLVNLCPEIIKLDRSLVAGIDRDPTRQAMADALASFARAIGARFIAEGVETEPEREYLLGRGVVFGQGYLFGRAEPLAVHVGHEHP